MGRGRSPRASGGDDRYDARDGLGYDDQPYGDAGNNDGPGYESREGAALVPINEGANLPALADDSTKAPVIIRGSGVSMGTPFIKRRERPLTLRIAVLTLMVCILVTGLFAVTPLGTSANGGGSSFQALAGAVVWHSEPTFHWYTATFGDTVEGIANKFHVEVGGIYQMNGLLAGQEIAVGKQYKIPDDPYYGKDFRPATYIVNSGNGTTTYGDSPWTSLAGNPAPTSDVTCGANGNGDPAGYHLGGSNKGSYWVRGFTWFHNGVDLSAPEGNPITAAQAGEVIWAGWDVGGLGWSVKINHCYGVSTVYGHMDKLLVQLHQLVDVGDQIGLEGSTGWSTGPHLHFMVEWNNNPVDPLGYYGWNTYTITH